MYFSNIELGEHLYWNVGTLFPAVHGEVLLVLWFVTTLVLIRLTTSNVEFAAYRTGAKELWLSALASVAQPQFGENAYRPWLPLATTTASVILLANWSGAALPWKLFALPSSELKSLAADPNTTFSLALLTSISYFYAGIKLKGPQYIVRYVSPVPVFLPINVLEDFTKPLSLGFRLFGNILAAEIIVGVLLFIYPYLLPIPLMLNGLFGATIQALVFTTLTCSYLAESLEKAYL
mmetsp:Transcript_132064/g.232628  ORF Transcript_132064/g.232628 Transcript_132064/m.232628 type:complete len:235 (+) Transcript_132064:72-776(+)